MLMKVSDVSKLTGLSKVSIYNKLKLKELKPYIVKNKGVTYVTEGGVNLIKDNIRLKDNITPYELNNKEIEESNNKNEEIQAFKEQLKGLSDDYLNSLKGEIASLKELIVEKDSQISELHKLIENSQVLLKKEQQKKDSQLLLEEHFQDVDKKLMDIKIKMEEKKEGEKKDKKSIFAFLKRDI